jgi:hypothetical protein
VKNIDEWSKGHLKLDPSQNLASPEGLEIFINGNQAFIDIIGRTEISWHGNEIVDQDEMQRYSPRILNLGE